ncbi:hypothetical protein SPN9CC_0018 [Salmonella phage SPN9CC]|nr:hypothetical protein SPN9CC_0018 [Salmonella phage SPN9CC]AEW47747.1 hypothetical protein SPN9CC_0018 [Salmonella phage SPN9CC]
MYPHGCFVYIVLIFKVIYFFKSSMPYCSEQKTSEESV